MDLPLTLPDSEAFPYWQKNFAKKWKYNLEIEK